MNYWLTTHYPHEPNGNLPWHIFVKREHDELLNKLTVGDGVIFVELLGRDGRGLGGVKCIAVISGGAQGDCAREEVPEVQGQTWKWEVPCANHDFDGELSKLELNRALGYALGDPLRIAGGVRRVTADGFGKVVEAFQRKRVGSGPR